MSFGLLATGIALAMWPHLQAQPLVEALSAPRLAELLTILAWTAHAGGVFRPAWHKAAALAAGALMTGAAAVLALDALTAF